MYRASTYLKKKNNLSFTPSLGERAPLSPLPIEKSDA